MRNIFSFIFKKHDALLVIKDRKTGEIKIIPGKNIVTTAGNTYYAERSCEQTPTNAFINLYLATAGPDPCTVTDNYSDFTLHTGGEMAVSSGYPICPCTDAENTGKGATIVTWKYEYLTTDGPFTDITHSFIAQAGASGTDPLLNAYKWASSWSKDAATTAIIYTNHTMLGS